ncbi:hypothetical protein [Streptomyces sp. MN13]
MTDLWIKQAGCWVPVPGVLAVEWDLVDPDDPMPPEPTPVQRALDILRPHLTWDHRYRP